MFERYDEKARLALFSARREAAQDGSEFAEPHHFLLGIFEQEPELLAALLGGLTLDAVRARTHELFPPRQPGGPQHDLPLSHSFKRALAYAAETEEQMNSPRITAAHQLIGLMRERGSSAAKVLASFELRTDSVIRAAKAFIPNSGESRTQNAAAWEPQPPVPRGGGGGDRGMHSTRTFAQALAAGHQDALEAGTTVMEEQNLFVGALASSPDLLAAMLPGRVSLDDVRARVRELYPPQGPPLRIPTRSMSPACRRLIEETSRVGSEARKRPPSAATLAADLLQLPGAAAACIIESFGVSVADAVAAAERLAGESAGPSVPDVGDFGGVGWGSWSHQHSNGYGAHSNFYEVGDGHVFETVQVYGGVEVRTVQRWTLSKDGKTLHYSQETVTPSKTDRHEATFDL